MAGFSSLNPLNITKRAFRTQHPGFSSHQHAHPRDLDPEKHCQMDDSDSESDYSSYSSSPSSRGTSGSYSSSRPILRKPSTGPPWRPTSISYRVPNRIMRYLCCALILSIMVFIISLIRMSIVSSNRVDLGDLGERPPPPPAPWESFEFLSRYYGGIRTIVPASENQPEYPLAIDEPAASNDTSTKGNLISVREVPLSKPFLAYSKHTLESHLTEYTPIQECFLHASSTIKIPSVQYYQGRPSGFPDNVMGSYEVLGLPEDICFERYGRLGPYGYGYSLRSGGTGAGQSGEMEGSEDVWKTTTGVNQIDYRTVDWADAQKRCFSSNAARFRQKTITTQSPSDVKTVGKDIPSDKQDDSAHGTNTNTTTKSVKLLPRTAVVIRSWDSFDYKEEDILHLRAMISELSLGSGGEYDVHLLVQVKDEAKHPIWADEEIYQQHLQESVPQEFHGITTLWSETQMLMLYQGIFDTFARGPDLPVHGSYRGLQMAMQYFAHRHSEYDFFWHWEIDIRYTGHYYNLFSQIDEWTKAQPRKGLWERNSRFYIPSVHGSWEDFMHMSRVQTEMGTESSNNMWSGLNGAKTPSDRPKTDKPIWGPERPKDPEDWFEIDGDPIPQTTFDKDKYEWGVGEDADLITLNPIFNPDGTTWLLTSDITGYNDTEGLPPRRAAIVSSSRMSRRLLTTMHRETAFKKHHAFTEMWPSTAALHHGYKAVYVPHPVYVDREWPTEYLANVMNAGRNGATGGTRTSVFGEREHNLLGMTWYYNAGFAPNLWKRWLGLKVNNEGGEEFEMTVDEGRSGIGVNGMKGGEGRMCLPPMLIHPVKAVELPVEGIILEEETPKSDPSA